MEHFSTRIMTNREQDFYSVMGPYLSRREIVKELGFPVWDEDNKIWFAVFSGEKLVGFSALRIKKDNAVLCSAYVLPEHRRNGIYTFMIRTRVAYAEKNGFARLVTTATEASRNTLVKCGFEPLHQKGQYTKMERSL
jgi:GNAT superfamily N-acetyltransferase